MNDRDQPIDEIMTEPVRSVTADTPTREVAAILFEEGIGSVVVGPADGIVTKTDLLAGIRENRLEAPVSELMTTPVVTISRDTDLQTAIDRMNEYEIKRLVVEAGGDAVGVVSTTDIRVALSTHPDAAIDMFAGAAVTEGPNTYECLSCGERVTAESKPGTCPVCDSPMRNISMPRN